MSNFIVPADALGSTISRATLDSWHLARRFVHFLEEISHPQAEVLRDELGVIAQDPESDEITYFVSDLFDVLNDAAPAGYHFGAHEGDGSDFGFWEHEVHGDEFWDAVDTE
jgi:hypothetical protein